MSYRAGAAGAPGVGAGRNGVDHDVGAPLWSCFACGWFEGCPEVVDRVRAPGTPAFRDRDARTGAEGRERAQHSDVRRRERVGIGQRAHPDVGQRSTARCPAAPAAAPPPRRGPRRGGSATSPDASAAASVTSARALAARHRQRGRIRRGDRRRVGEAVRQGAARPGASGLPYSAVSLAPSRRAAATETCWPSTARIASSSPSTWPGSAAPGRPAPAGRSPRRHQEPGNGVRVGVQVQQAPAALHRRRHVAQVVKLPARTPPSVA